MKKNKKKSKPWAKSNHDFDPMEEKPKARPYPEERAKIKSNPRSRK